MVAYAETFVPMEDYQTIKQQLYSLPLSERTIESVKDILFFAEQMHLPLQTSPLKEGMLVYRARPQDSTTRRTAKHEISFRRDLENVPQGRGNIRENPVFYGSVRSVQMKDAWFIACNEVAERIAPSCQSFTVGVWRVKKDLPLVTLSTKQEQASGMDNARRAYESFMEFIKKVPADKYVRTVELFDCLGEEFSKDAATNDDYWISAAFAHIIYCNFAGGISYPSVANKFMAYNVCISPEYVDDHLDLVGGQLVQYQKGEDTIHVGNYEMFNGNVEPFKWEPLDPKFSGGRTWMDHGYPHK